MSHKKEIIRQPNSFTYTNQQFTAIEKRIVYNILSRMDSGINVQPELFSKNMKFSFNWKDLQSDYNDVRSALEKLSKRQITIKDNFEKQEYLAFTPFPVVGMKNGLVSITLLEDAIPHFMELKKGYTQYQLKAALSLESKYAQRMYELLCSKIWREGGKANNMNHWRGLEISTLRDLLGIEPNKLKQKTDFEKRVLIMAQNEIRKSSDIDFEYKFDEDTKVGKEYKTISFTIYPRQNGAEWHELKMEINHDINTADSNIKFSSAVQILASEYQFSRIEQDEILTNGKAIDKFLETALNVNNNVYGDIRNKTAYMRTALKEFLNR
jgi:plasmid replication initiation protein